jgi:hypothetical protein
VPRPGADAPRKEQPAPGGDVWRRDAPTEGGRMPWRTMLIGAPNASRRNIFTPAASRRMSRASRG